MANTRYGGNDLHARPPGAAAAPNGATCGTLRLTLRKIWVQVCRSDHRNEVAVASSYPPQEKFALAQARSAAAAPDSLDAAIHHRPRQRRPGGAHELPRAAGIGQRQRARPHRLPARA